MKIFKKTIAAAVLSSLLSLLLPGCTHYGYAVRVTMLTNYSSGDYSILWTQVEVDYKNLKNGDKLDITLPAGIHFLGLYFDDNMIFDENLVLKDAKQLKSRLKNGSVFDNARTCRLELNYELLSFDLELDFAGGGAAYASPEEDVRVIRNITVLDLFNHASDYFPFSWKENTHFIGWQQEGSDHRLISHDSALIGWNNVSQFVTVPNGTTTLRFTAQYGEGNYYVCSFYPKGDDYVSGKTWQVAAGSDLDLADYTPLADKKYEKSFFLWSKDNQEFVPFDGTVFEDLQLYYYELRYKTIYLHPQNGDATGTVDVTEKTAPIYRDGWTLNAPDGYTFAGWYKTRDYAGEAVSVKEVPSYDEIEYGKTYYAKWAKTEEQDEIK